MDTDALEADRLLKSEAYSAAGTLGNRERCDIFPIEDDLSLRRLFNTHDQFCQRGFTASVGTGYDNKTTVVNREVQVLQNRFLPAVLLDTEGEVLEFQHKSFSHFLFLNHNISII